MSAHQETLNRIFDELLIINGVMNRNIEVQAKSLGYTNKEYLVLLDVLTHQGTSQNAMCDRLGIKKSAASKLLTQLEANDSIIRKTCTSDRRESKLFVENEKLLESLCKTSMIEKTFNQHLNFNCELPNIEKSLIDLKDMLSDIPE